MTARAQRHKAGALWHDVKRLRRYYETRTDAMKQLVRDFSFAVSGIDVEQDDALCNPPEYIARLEVHLQVGLRIRPGAVPSTHDVLSTRHAFYVFERWHDRGAAVRKARDHLMNNLVACIPDCACRGYDLESPTFAAAIARTNLRLRDPILMAIADAMQKPV